MSLLAIAEAIFFLVFGISHFIAFRYSSTICAIAAIILGVLMVVKI